MQVQLDGNGNIIGVFASAQPGLPGAVKIADNDPRIAAWNAQKASDASKPALGDKLQMLINALIAGGILKTDPTI